ncbi:TIGR01777 family oxidoreductase [Cellulomonas denverensis]|uniref:TIGR01777 family protein n=1 Tax=Cellulomonas denverensis TaxID=264297 RepID=A0A7X6KWP0_9CELL|nr:TIGR01777 family oxidoreductase [Cellulomonas denverensis]NKY23240.1 TIGR01777 family protein [Cellulomonas denverensis]GIG26358.1 epimerase [Cellulomonas denverensis]
MRVVIAGSSGLIGSALTELLRSEGAEVVRLVRRSPGAPDERRWDPDRGELDPGALAGADVVVNVAGAGVGDKRLTTARKQVVLSSRTTGTALLARTMAGMDAPPPVLLQGSASGAYGDRGEEVLTEDSARGDTFLAGVVRAWEDAASPAVADPRIRVAFLRTGIVLTPGGGALGPLLPLLRLGLGGPLGSGRNYWAWITLTDEVRAIRHLMDVPVAGPVNLVADPARSVEVIRALAAELHRPAVLPVPGFALRLVLGEFADEILASQRIVPAVLDSCGFVHRHRDLGSAARAILG